MFQRKLIQRKLFRRKFIVVLVLALSLATLAQQKKRLLNLNEDGVAVQGYDVVAFFTDNKPVKGNVEFQSLFNGARYYFANADHKKLFDASPAKYEPQFGGFCAYAVSQGYTAKIDVDAFQIVDGRLILQYNKDIREKFNLDTPGNLKKAEKNWPEIVEKKGK